MGTALISTVDHAKFLPVFNDRKIKKFHRIKHVTTKMSTIFLRVSKAYIMH